MGCRLCGGGGWALTAQDGLLHQTPTPDPAVPPDRSPGPGGGGWGPSQGAWGEAAACGPAAGEEGIDG